MKSAKPVVSAISRGRILLIAAIAMLAIAVASCRHDNAAELRLDAAESLMDSHPDSALEILQTISANDLRNLPNKALYGLLLTQAMEKNWLEPDNDSIISLSADYYDSSDDPYRQAMSNYYKGVVCYNNGNYPSAILSYFKALEISESHGFDFYAAMSCRGISDIYNKSYNTSEEVHFARKEYEYFQKSGKQPHLNYALLDYARALYNHGDYEKAMIISTQALDSATLYQDNTLKLATIRLEALNHIEKGNFHDAYPLLSEICRSDMSETADSLRLCETMFEIGLHDEAYMLLDKTSDANVALKNWVKYRIDRENRNYSDALQKLELIDSINNQTIRTSLSHNLTTSLTDYFKIKMARDDLKIKEERINRNIAIFCSILVISMIFALSIYYYRRQSKKISEKVLLAEQLAESLKKSNLEKENASEILKWMRATRYDLLEELCSIAYRNNDDNDRRRKVADAVDRLIEDLSTQSDKTKQWEKEVDSIHANIFSDFRNDLPKLKDLDYRLFLFMVAGLEMPTITLLLKEDKTEAVYNRKRRLKVKVSNLDSPNRDRYLKYFK
ncbi:MAG: hypothetical protein K2K93_01455 [Muribaculaceae bacterium]|nr:hypothetical protein [Muribaculaceae bacterium]